MDDPQYQHRPVLLAPVAELLNPQPGQVFLDGTVGLGGHALELAPKLAPGGRYIGLDADGQLLSIARGRLSMIQDVDVVLEHASYADFPGVLQRLGVPAADHMLLDLGVNSAQLSDPARGFSFEHDGPLDMRFDLTQKTTAADLVNGLGERELSDLFYHYGQEPLSRKIAKKICDLRRDSRILTTRRLAYAVESAYVAAGVSGGRTNPATRVFQALRIAVNRELDNLTRFLAAVLDYLTPGGKLAVISFQSLEDALVKKSMREGKEAGKLRLLTRSPVTADQQELRRNPRSRSAKLRVAQRVEE